MSIDAHDKCSRAICFLRFNWIRNPKVVLSEKLQTVGLKSDYLKNDQELFEVFRKKLYRRLNKRYQGLLDLMVPAHFIRQTKIMWSMLKRRPRDGQTYEQIRKAIATPQFRKPPASRTVVEKFVVGITPKQLKGNDFARKSLKDLKQIERENKILKALITDDKI